MSYCCSWPTDYTLLVKNRTAYFGQKSSNICVKLGIKWSHKVV